MRGGPHGRQLGFGAGALGRSTVQGKGAKRTAICEGIGSAVEIGSGAVVGNRLRHVRIQAPENANQVGGDQSAFARDSRRRRRESTAIVCMKLGDLRMDDNPILHAATRFNRCIFLCILKPAEGYLEDALASASDLQRSLRRLKAELWIEVSAEPEAVLRTYTELVPHAVVLRNEHAGDNCTHPRGCRVEIVPQHPSRSQPITAPTFLPPPPAIMWTKFSAQRAPVSLKAGGMGETQAMCSLRRILTTPQTAAERVAVNSGAHGVCGLFCRELAVGCISRVRVEFETRKKGAATSSSKVATGSATNGSEQGANSLFLLGGVGVASIQAFDLKGSKRRPLAWDEESGKLYLTNHASENELAEWLKHKSQVLRRLFFPEDVTPDYYAFTAIRFVQRTISATVTVLGTQSLILALGLKSGANNQAAAIAWVLKNGFGRVGKMLWAGTRGRDFDVDPKTWRFKSAVIYTVGNGMEILTQIFPGSFLFFATMAITFKQVSWLTATATRNAMYRSFGGKRDNIGDITAKGEAQIVVAELIGMGLGILLSKGIGTRKRNVIAAYAILSLLDIAAIYQELRVVVFRTLNPQRTGLIVEEFTKRGRLPDPYEISQREHIMLQPAIGADGVTFTGLLDAASTKEELASYMQIFRKEKFLIGCKMKRGSKPCSGKQCKIVLNENVRSRDILRAMLVLGYLRREEEVTFDVIDRAHEKGNHEFRKFVDGVKAAGWNTEQLLYSTLKRRCSW